MMHHTVAAFRHGRFWRVRPQHFTPYISAGSGPLEVAGEKESSRGSVRVGADPKVASLARGPRIEDTTSHR
jgi:hypothetical protein